MTLSEIRARGLARLDELASAPVSFTAAELTAAVNRGQRLFAALSLSIERTGTLDLAAGDVWRNLLAAFPQWFLPLRCSRNTTAGTPTPALWGVPVWGEAIWGELDTETVIATNRVRPATLAELDALDASWQNATGTGVQRYGVRGFNLAYFYPALTAAGKLDFTYAAMPRAMAVDADEPEIPAENHAALIDYAVYELPAFQWGGEYLVKGTPFIERFFDEAVKAAAYVRARSLALRYDTAPFEITAKDRSRWIKKLARVKEAREVTA
jgi:hypothetical protein